MLSFYNIDVNYLEFLHNIDPEVEYSSSYKCSTHQKIFLGIITTVDGQKYFIPFTSAKKSHENPKLSLSSKNHLLIYEEVSEHTKNTHTDKFYRSTDDPNKFYMLIASLQFNKAIPVIDGLYTPYDITKEPNKSYKNLLLKEYSFCLKRKDNIIKTASETIEAIRNGVKVKYSCNLKLLESKMNDFNKQS